MRSSVIVPIFQSASVLTLFLESLRSTMESDTQLILVNDGSPEADIGELGLEPADGVAHYALHPDELTPAAIADMTGGRKFDVVIDAVGNQLAFAMGAVAKGGRVVPMGYDDTYRVEIEPTRLIDDGLSIVAAVAVHDAIGPAIDFAADLPGLDAMVTTEVEMADYREAFAATMGVDLITGRSVEIKALKAVIRS